jgi:hypothetical protein
MVYEKRAVEMDVRDGHYSGAVAGPATHATEYAAATGDAVPAAGGNAECSYLRCADECDDACDSAASHLADHHFTADDSDDADSKTDTAFQSAEFLQIAALDDAADNSALIFFFEEQSIQ